MQMKTGHLTSRDAQDASNAHYDAENAIMSHVRNMTLAGKRKLVEKMPDHCSASEEEAKS